MKKILFIALASTIFIQGNDGSYTLSGNQLMPITESNIHIEEEVLSIKRLKSGVMDVNVAYTFVNPGPSKDVLVGFEAHQPEGDIDPNTECPNRFKNEHPCIVSFSVKFNTKELNYRVHLSGGLYVYKFNAHFEHGINHIDHHYVFKHGDRVAANYVFDYILTAAKRWGKGKIKDFTLILDMGDNTQFDLANSFFINGKEWDINGTYQTIESNDFTIKKATHFEITKSPAVFRKKDFDLSGDLELISNMSRSPHRVRSSQITGGIE